ncbi:hypothetical protein P4H70_12145 [Paenibacillus ehimensis]|uniref:hypothetical protein n=1 Tax=Paenibacillus ehimensis TaxID=79264 RepID=UPI002DBF478B|nr:hypothetical protein [Paenibacillus ehimensis]MEC0209682.1 hypothetical protein [Paenibacillus ehimensis]
MSKVVAAFRCKECQDIFEANSEGFTECKCGKCCVKPNEYSTTYETINGKGNYFVRISDQIYRFKEEYTELSEEFYELWNKLKQIKEEREYQFPRLYIYERQDRSADGNVFMRSLSAEIFDANNYHELTYLKFKLDLRQKFEPNSALIRLQKFYSIFNKVNSKEIDLNNRGKLKEIADDWYREQCDLYNYTFYV